jgi:toxin ParE1/3/4
MEQIRLQRTARKELAKAIAYFEEKETGLGLRFRMEFEHAVGLIRENPDIGAVWERSSYRHWTIERFRYVLYYTLRPTGLWIVAVAHGSRRPNYWRRRKLEE